MLYLIQHDEKIFKITNEIVKQYIISIQVINPIKTKNIIYEKLSNFIIDGNYLQVDDINIIIKEMYKHIVIQQTPKQGIKTPKYNTPIQSIRNKNKYKLIIKANDDTYEPEILNFESIDKIVEFLNLKFNPNTKFNRVTIDKLYKQQFNFITSKSPNKHLLQRLEIKDI